MLAFLLAIGAKLWAFLKSPLGQRVAGVLAAVGMLLAVDHYGYIRGSRHVRDQWDAAIELAKAQAKAKETKAAAISDKTQAATTKEQVRIRTVTRTILERVPIYVTPDTDRRFPLPLGLVRVHDAAARGDLTEVSGAPASDDGQASAITASAAGSTIAQNYGSCRADQSRLEALQDWVTQQRILFNGPH